MSGIGGALDIAKWTLYNSQLALNVTSHNIANANTEGYSRQNLEIEANIPINTAPGAIGTGARGTEVIRAYDEFVNEQVNLKTSQYYFWQSQSEALGEIETMFNESEENGLNELMGKFWDAWSDLSNNPEGTAEREALIGASENLVQFIGDIDGNLRDYQSYLDTQIQGSAEVVNSITKQIANLNVQITSSEVDGAINANDLRDLRDNLINKLSEYMDISYYEEESSGQVMVYVLGGTPLVLGGNSYQIEAERNVATGFADLIWTGSSGNTVNITNKLEGGKIAGWVNVRDNKIGSYIDSMNTLVQELAWQVNSLHAEGVGLVPMNSMVGTVELSLSDDLETNFMFSDGYESDGQFDIVVYDSSGNVAHTYAINPDAGDNTVGDWVSEINEQAQIPVTNGEIAVPELAASVTNGHFQIQASGSYTFAIKPHDGGQSSNALAIMGVNTFFSWAEITGQPTDDITQTLSVNSALKNNPDLIAAGYLDNTNELAQGSNDVALAIFSLQDEEIAGLGSSLDSYYSTIVARVGIDVEQANSNEKYNDTLLDQYVQKKESITGVNLDEEMTDILKFQQLYQAAAKIISICDEMLDTLLSS